MAAKSKTLVLEILQYLGVFFLIIWFGLGFYWSFNSPTNPDESNGLIYTMNIRRTLVYLNVFQYLLLYALPIFFFITLLTYKVLERRIAKKNPKN